MISLSESPCLICKPDKEGPLYRWTMSKHGKCWPNAFMKHHNICHIYNWNQLVMDKYLLQRWSEKADANMRTRAALL